MEVIPAKTLLREALPDLRVRVVNVVDLMRLQPASEHPHGLQDDDFDALFTTDCPVVFAYHGYPWLIHRLTYRRRNHPNIHVRGYKEEGTTTTPFDMVVRNNMDRYQLAIDALARLPAWTAKSDPAVQTFRAKLALHRDYIVQHGEDMPEIRDWVWKA
jgi:xylulose-5-phosphate/fructose-6-phosphate phosphoketolase